MLKKTKGIVLSSIRYKESSIIVKIFTRDLGLKSYLVNGVRTKGSASKIALYQPLTLLDLVVYDKENAGLQRVSEVRLQQPNQLIPFEFGRIGIALFMTEVISRSIFENYQNADLFDFLFKSICILDNQNAMLGQFPLVFLIEQAKYLGFAPEDEMGFLDESRSQPFSPEELRQAIDYLQLLMSESYHCALVAPILLRRKILDHLLDFYSQQLENPTPWKSLSILRQLL